MNLGCRFPLVGSFLGILWMLGICRFAGKRVLEQVLTTFVRRTESGKYSTCFFKLKNKTISIFLYASYFDVF
jgi:hypothetical protein